MYVYKENGQGGGYSVGYYLTKWKYDGSPFNEWQEESSHYTVKAAAARVNYLNGGTGREEKNPYAEHWRNPYKNKGWQPEGTR